MHGQQESEKLSNIPFLDSVLSISLNATVCKASTEMPFNTYEDADLKVLILMLMFVILIQRIFSSIQTKKAYVEKAKVLS